jgi:hypothetical protein
VALKRSSPISGLWFLAAALALSLPLTAHRGEPVRTLRLQLGKQGFEGLISYSLPPGPAADKLFAVPRGLIPGERMDEPMEEVLGRRAAAEALRGLRAAIGSAEGELRPAELKLVEAKARQTQTRALQAMVLVQLNATLPAGDIVLELADGGAVPLRVTLAAPIGYKLTLLKGVGLSGPEGLSLRPRPDRPCLVRIARPPAR